MLRTVDNPTYSAPPLSHTSREPEAASNLLREINPSVSLKLEYDSLVHDPKPVFPASTAIYRPLSPVVHAAVPARLDRRMASSTLSPGTKTSSSDHSPSATATLRTASSGDIHRSRGDRPSSPVPSTLTRPQRTPAPLHLQGLGTVWHTFDDVTMHTLLAVFPAALNDGLTAASAAADRYAADLVALALHLEEALRSSPAATHAVSQAVAAATKAASRTFLIHEQYRSAVDAMETMRLKRRDRTLPPPPPP